MGYTGIYSLGTRCLTEFLSTFLAIGLGEALLANELLPNTKGHGMGFGWIALGFGLSFAFAIHMFSYASAHLNPAACLALWITGGLDFTDFLALSLSEMAGGFVGACMVYLVYMPHFRTVPETTPASHEDNLLRTRDHIDANALRVASYSTKPNPSNPNSKFHRTLRHRKTNGSLASSTATGSRAGASSPVSDNGVGDVPERSTLAQRLAEAKYYLSSQAFDDDPEAVLSLLSGGTFMLLGAEVPFPKDFSYEVRDDATETPGAKLVDNAGAGAPVVTTTTTAAGTTTDLEAGGDLPQKRVLKRRHSLQVADMQRRLRKLENEMKPNRNLLPMTLALHGLDLPSTPYLATTPMAERGAEASKQATATFLTTPTVVTEQPTKPSTSPHVKIDSDKPDTIKHDLEDHHAHSRSHSAKRRELAKSLIERAEALELARETALMRAAILADQATKLSVFASRPAIYLPAHNFIVEAIGTCFLIFGAFLIDDRINALSDVAGGKSGVNVSVGGLLVGLYITMLVVCLGGPTGFACNPARDLAPRFAHWILPIPGKGKSEWNYGFVINIAAMVGGAVGGGLYLAMHKINKAF